MSRIATKLVWADSPFNAEQMPGRHGQGAHPCADKSANFDLQSKRSINLRTVEKYANSPAGGKDANSATSVDFAFKSPFNGVIEAQRTWANSSEDVNPASENGFTVVKGKKRRRGSAESPEAAAHSSNARRSGTNHRQRTSTERVPRAQEIKTTRTHMVEARARQASSTEEHCLYIEHCPELEPYHYLKAIDEMVGGTSDVVQIAKVNGHLLLGLSNKALAERLINEGLEVEGMSLKTFPFYKRAARITIGNLPFFVKDASVIDALLPYGRITSIVPKQLKADGAPPHYHRDVRAYLDQNLSGQWIGRRGPIEFPARSPDLTPLDFFLWGTVKDGVYKRKPRNLDILWNEIQAVCREISLDVLIRCTESVRRSTGSHYEKHDPTCLYDGKRRSTGFHNLYGKRRSTGSYYEKHRPTCLYDGKRRSTGFHNLYGKGRSTGSYYEKHRPTCLYDGKRHSTGFHNLYEKRRYTGSYYEKHGSTFQHYVNCFSTGLHTIYGKRRSTGPHYGNAALLT
ncbi:hypothetical protein LAZ67_X000269 [Cordylochernes scorpioides]|uniref:Uncharacterized protein n=1 Tax=Cordylochernes scorpioides TaxID=51811 RepID=A0ABY6LRG7_9ARAC|nr:hypothetical protein LAZ67_X000269 [Cordylochernes scorpioides]